MTRCSLYRGETLVMASDGADVPAALARLPNAQDLHPLELASELVRLCKNDQDDATVAVIRLVPIS